MFRLRFVLIAFLFITLIIPLRDMAQQVEKSVKVEVKKGKFLESRFLLYLPEGYQKNDDRQWPLLLFLHGSGESGDMIQFVKKNGPPRLIEEGKKFPYIVVSPQCPEDERWSVDVLDMLLNEMVRSYHADPGCIMVTGLSMGGTGTWDLAIAYPQRFAAIVPICGRVDPASAVKIKDQPVWVFHGAKDDIVPPEISVSMVDALKAAGSPVKFTLYPEANHDSWTAAYNDPELWKWLAEQCR